MNTDLVAITRDLDKQKVKYDVLRNGKAAILVLSDYGRILGCWSDIEKNSHFWLNQNFLDGNLDTNWVNPGGHRIWLAPERDFFISDLKKPFETYKVPNVLDPGNYQYHRDDSSMQLSNTGKLWSYTKQKNCNFDLKRTVSLFNSDTFPKGAFGKQVHIAGYEDSVALTTEGCPAGIWSLIQVPLHGIISMPISQPECHKVFWGDPGNLVKYKNELMSLRLEPSVKQEFKIGFDVTVCGSSITYLRKYHDEVVSLIIINFKAGADHLYIDTPWNEPDNKGYAVQFFCGGIHGFGEIEVHGPVCEEQGVFHSQLEIEVSVIHVENPVG